MELKKIDFGVVLGQSGVQGFFGEGDEYKHHRFYKLIPGFSFKGLGFVAKTMTLKPRIYPQSSNTELIQEYKMKHMFPSSIWATLASLRKGYMLNAVGLANPGAEALLKMGKWQRRIYQPFQISIMLMEKEPKDRINEIINIAQLLVNHGFRDRHVRCAIQMNYSCPNTGDNHTMLLTQTIQELEAFRAVFPKMPIIPKFDTGIAPEFIKDLAPYCDAFCISNTIPFGKKDSGIEWDELFPSKVSPLTKYFEGKFSGGLSGKPLFPVLCNWLERMEKVDPSVKIIAGGGIMEPSDIDMLARYKNVHAIALGSVAIMRPWKLQKLIKHAKKVIINK